jgi:Helix-turn-helix domain
VLVRVGGGGLLEEHPRSGAAELLAGLADRGERHCGGRGEVDVVVADDRDVLRNPDLMAGHLLQDAEGDEVVGAENGGGPVRRPHGGDVRAGFLPCGHVERPDVDHVQVFRPPPGVAKSAQRPLVAVGDLADRARAADVGDVLVAGGQQVGDGEVTAEHVVDRDRALAARRRPAVDEDHRRSAPLQPGEPRARADHRRDEHALHPVLFEQFQVALLLAFLVVAVAQDDGEAGLARLVFHAARQVGEERVGHVEHHQAERPAPPRAKLAGGLVAHEAELRDRGVHPLARRPGHDVGPVEHVGHRGDGDAGVGGDLPDADRHGYPLLHGQGDSMKRYILALPASLQVRPGELVPPWPDPEDGLAGAKEPRVIVDLAPAYLVRLFKDATGLPPKAYLAQVRAERAAVLLLNTHDPVTSVGREVGWPDQNYFARRFKAHYGLSATTYRKRFAAWAAAHPTGGL